MTSSTLRAQHRSAILWMVASCFWAGVMMVLVRYISFGMHTAELVFFRNCFALLWWIPWVCYLGKDALKVKSDKRLFLLRGMIGVTAMHGWFYALAVLPIADATALSFTAPLFTTLIAILFLKEKIGIHRITALLIGFIGALIVLRPGSGSFTGGGLMMLGVAFAWACVGIIIKVLTRTERPEVVVIYMTLIMTPLSIPGAVMNWQPVTLPQIGWLVLLGLISNVFQFFLSTSISKADMTVILPYDFLRLVFASILAFLAFGEVPDVMSVLGAAVILSGAVYAAYREKKHHPRMDVPTPSP